MENKLILCCNKNDVNNLNLLGDSFITHNDNQTNVVNGEFVCNYDYLLITYYKDIENHINNPNAINMARLPKNQQMDLARKHKIVTPNYAYIQNNVYDINVYMELINKMLGDKSGYPDVEIVVKKNDGARGLGQAVVKNKDIHRFITEMVIGDGVPSVDSDYYKLGGDIVDDKSLMESIKFNKDDVLFMVKVDIEEEFRVVFNCLGEYDIVQRKINNQADWQANGGGTVIGGTKRDYILEYMQSCGIIDFIESTGLPFGSIDLFIDAYGAMGIFEYCPQFGYKSHNVDNIAKLVKRGMLHKIAQIGK